MRTAQMAEQADAQWLASTPEEVAQLQKHVTDFESLAAEGLPDDIVTRDARMTLLSAFAMFDADGDGKLTKAEVIAVLTRKTGKGTEFSDEAARATWQRWQAEFDPNNDGKVSVEELLGPPKMGGSGIAR